VTSVEISQHRARNAALRFTPVDRQRQQKVVTAPRQQPAAGQALAPKGLLHVRGGADGGGDGPKVVVRVRKASPNGSVRADARGVAGYFCSSLQHTIDSGCAAMKVVPRHAPAGAARHQFTALQAAEDARQHIMGRETTGVDKDDCHARALMTRGETRRGIAADGIANNEYGWQLQGAAHGSGGGTQQL
jgi:hypothetical protein